MEIKLDFSLKEMRDFLRNKGYHTFGVDTWNSDYDLRIPGDIPRIVKVECALKVGDDRRIDTSEGSYVIYSKYGLENQFMREIKNKLLS